MTSRLASTTLRIGALAPEIELPGLDGGLVRLTDARGICGVLLIFAPGAWSPATRRQVGEINAVYEQFREIGVQVVVLITQNATSLQDRLASYAIPFPILADEHRETAKDFGVFRALSWDGIGVTRPAVFLIDRDGVIRFVYVGERDSDVPDTESLLHLAKDLIGVAPIEITEGEVSETPVPDGREWTPVAGDEAIEDMPTTVLAVAVDEGSEGPMDVQMEIPDLMVEQVAADGPTPGLPMDVQLAPAAIAPRDEPPVAVAVDESGTPAESPRDEPGTELDVPPEELVPAAQHGRRLTAAATERKPQDRSES